MASQSHRILMTRPADQGSRFADALRARFGAAVDITESPLIAPRMLSPILPEGPFDAVIFTSQTAVAAAQGLPAQVLAALPRLAYAVGDSTAHAARMAGFVARSAGADAQALIRMLQTTPPGRVLHLHGQETRGDVVGHLKQAGIPAMGAVVYVQEPQPPTPQAQAWLADDRPVIVPLFSPRTAMLFAALHPSAPIWVAALSPAVDAAATLHAARRVTAARPDAAAMLDAVAHLVTMPTDP